MNMPLVLAALLAFTAPLVAGGVPQAAGPAGATASEVAGSTTAAVSVVADGVVGATEPASGGGVEVAEVDLTVPPLAEVTAAEAADAQATAGPDAVAGPVPGEVTPDELTAEPAPQAVPDGADETATPVEPAPGTTVVADELTTAGFVETAPVDAEGFQTIGVTWPDGADGAGLDARVRTSDDGVWGEWVALEASDAPDAGTADAAIATRGGTDPLWIGDADAVQLAFAATESGGPEGLSLALVGSELEDGPAGGAIAAVGAASTTDAAFVPAAAQAAGPRVITRAQWGAPAPVCTPSAAATLVGAVVHHTAGSNAYATVAQAMQQIRNDASYHIRGRGWCDLGYNFVVDKWGNIYEGRVGSMSKAVIGVHAGGFNTGTVGVSMLGTYTAPPSAATQRAVASIIGWRLGAYGVDPRGTMTYWTGPGQNSRYSNENVRLRRVFAHRDVAYTACPGEGGYAAMPAIRTMAADAGWAERFQRAESLVEAMYEDLLGRAPDESGLAGYKSAIAGGASAVDVTRSITSSEEYNRRKITQAYARVLGRRPDEAGVRSWLAAIARGTVVIDEIANHLVASDEFYARSGGTDAGLVRTMYTSLLGRSGSAEEVVYWTSRVRTQGRGAVIEQVTGSREAAQRKVQRVYKHFLGRFPDIPGQSLWTDVLLARGEAAVRANVVGSEEYRLRSAARFR